MENLLQYYELCSIRPDSQKLVPVYDLPRTNVVTAGPEITLRALPHSGKKVKAPTKNKNKNKTKKVKAVLGGATQQITVVYM